MHHQLSIYWHKKNDQTKVYIPSFHFSNANQMGQKQKMFYCINDLQISEIGNKIHNIPFVKIPFIS